MRRRSGEVDWVVESIDDLAAFVEEPFDDEELASLALAAEPLSVPDAGAVPIDTVLRSPGTTLSAWYMPAVTATRLSGWRRPVLLGLVVTLVALEALGLCSVFGQVVIG